MFRTLIIDFGKCAMIYHVLTSSGFSHNNTKQQENAHECPNLI